MAIKKKENYLSSEFKLISTFFFKNNQFWWIFVDNPKIYCKCVEICNKITNITII